ncbi:alpha/beta hydrolase [Amycolatopsis sp. EV170708-02-1]|uniref:alpha/beta hydrolase n=1 Tax=Amycolatopsis sp. EV170708-02-1 TaxID=2919322 RepID=UPI001F0CA7DE|nr:alpha/beta hydrolase [Amycolatopsis sp. EV170708-02-1]UMP03413.1 alpha/beta hydrolase [Amycolatopsis sp. EV170708-02-1]
MPFKDSAVAWRPALLARTFQAVYPVVTRLALKSPKLQFATKPVAGPERITIPTRHGDIPALLYSPLPADLEAQLAAGRRPPVHLLVHGGAFVVRHPEQEDNVARYLASEVGCYVVLPDYDVGPQVRFPVAEQECYDAYLWILEQAGTRGWDKDRVSVGGASAGAKLSLSVLVQALQDGQPAPVAASLEYGVSDISLPDESRTSPRRMPIIGPWMMRMIRETYFLGADLTDPVVSPAKYPKLGDFPPLLILTGGLDTLRHDMRALADEAGKNGVEVVRHEFDDSDHGFTHVKPVETARAAITMVGDHLRTAYDTTTNRGTAA